MRKFILTSLTIMFAILSIILIWTFISRVAMPFNSEGKYFDKRLMIVYSEQSKLVYGIGSVIVIALTGFSAFLTIRILKK